MTSNTIPVKCESAYRCPVTMNDILSAFKKTSNLFAQDVLEINERVQTISRKDRIYLIKGRKHINKQATQAYFAKAWFCNSLKEILHISDDLLKQKRVSAKEWSSFFNNTAENTLSRGLFQQVASQCLSKNLIYELCSHIQRMVEEQVWSIKRREIKHILTTQDISEFESKERYSNIVQNASLFFEVKMLDDLLHTLGEKVNRDGTFDMNLSYIFNEEIDPVIRLAAVTVISLFRESDIEKHYSVFKNLFETMFEVRTAKEWKEYSKIYSYINRRSIFVQTKSSFKYEEILTDHKALKRDEQDRYQNKCVRIMRNLLDEHKTQIRLVSYEELNEQLCYCQFDKFVDSRYRWFDDPISIYVDLSQAPKEYCEIYQDAICKYIQKSIYGRMSEGFLRSPFFFPKDELRKIKPELRKSIDECFGLSLSMDSYEYDLILDGFLHIPNVKIQHKIPNPWINDYEVDEYIVKLIQSEIENIVIKWKNVQVTLFVPEALSMNEAH